LLVAQAQTRARAVDLAGADGLLAQLTNRVLETVMEAEMVEHLGYETNQVQGRNGGVRQLDDDQARANVAASRCGESGRVARPINVHDSLPGPGQLRNQPRHDPLKPLV
jgi:hypothetical protein